MTERIEWTFEVDGMSCGHCARAVDESLRAVPGVVRSTTNHADGRAVVLAEPAVDAAALVAAIEGAGYRVLGRTSRAAAGDGG
jgi:copper chaperone CopZ